MPQKRGFSNEQSTIGFHPLLEWAPEMAPFYAKPILVDLRAKVLNDEVRLANSGAAVFNNNLVSPILSGWHNHYSWTVPETGLQCRNPEQILCNIYVDGTMPDVGPLIVLPRNLNDSIYNQGETNDKWTGQETVSISADSAVIFDRRSGIAPDVEIPTGYAICGVDIIKVGTIQLHTQKII
tara:strand:- start:220 stop:762 length:543 start_codon:yes stop_codon:yes gene_type:complete